MASNPGPGADNRLEAKRLIEEVDIRRARATDFPRYWPSARVALCLLAESARGSLVDRIRAIVAVGDAACVDQD